MDLHHHHQRYTPGGDFHRAPRGRIQISKELILIEDAKLGTELHREVAVGKSGLHGGHRRLGNRW
jgi:hypothetical protein